MLRIHVFLMLLAMSLGGAAQMTFDGRWPSLAELADGSEGPDILVGEEELSAYEAYTEANRLIIEQNWVEAEAILETMMAVDADNRNLAYKRHCASGPSKDGSRMRCPSPCRPSVASSPSGTIRLMWK